MFGLVLPPLCLTPLGDANVPAGMGDAVMWFGAICFFGCAPTTSGLRSAQTPHPSPPPAPSSRRHPAGLRRDRSLPNSVRLCPAAQVVQYEAELEQEVARSRQQQRQQSQLVGQLQAQLLEVSTASPAPAPPPQCGEGGRAL